MIENSDNIKITIGYAEDQRWFRDDVVKMLGDENFEFVVIADDGQQLIENVMVLDKVPDIFLTDLNMPVMDGIEASRQIIIRWPNAKIVILSSEVRSFYVIEAEKAGAVGFLHKIIDYKNIGTALREVYLTGATALGKLV